MSADLKQVWSYGGGVQSCAIAVLILQGKLPRPDIAVIADTGREKQTTWDYMNQHVRPALEGFGIEIHRVHKDKYAFQHDDILSKAGNTLLIPVFTTESGSISKLPGFCSGWWKIEVVENFLRRDMNLKRSEYRTWIGYSLDEPKRYLRMMNGEDYKNGLLHIPLVESVRMTRGKCMQLVKDFGWPEPPRSSCWMCPNMRDAEWMEIKTNRPDEFERACVLDEEMRLDDPHAWLHESCTPLRSVQFSTNTNQRELCLEGGCFT